MGRQFNSIQRIDLSEFGSEWAGAYVDMARPGFSDAREALKIKRIEDDLEAAEKMMEYTKTKFVSGKAPYEGELVNLTTDDLEGLPIGAVTMIVNVVTGEEKPDPNSLKPSTEQSSEAPISPMPKPTTG